MGKVKLPDFIVKLPDGPHKWDEIRHYKNKLKKEGAG